MVKTTDRFNLILEKEINDKDYVEISIINNKTKYVYEVNLSKLIKSKSFKVNLK